MFGIVEQEPIYDGRGNIPGQVYEMHDEGQRDQAISEGYLPVGMYDVLVIYIYTYIPLRCEFKNSS
jgi:hypothetical protein